MKKLAVMLPAINLLQVIQIIPNSQSFPAGVPKRIIPVMVICVGEEKKKEFVGYECCLNPKLFY